MSHKISIQDGRANIGERKNTVTAGPSETKGAASSNPAADVGPASASFDPYNTRRGLWLEGEYRKGLVEAGSYDADEPEEGELQPSLTHEGAETYGDPRGGNAPRIINLPVPVAAGLFCLGQALWEKDAAGQYRLDHLIGITPASNHAANHFARRLGGEYCGTVPGFCWFERERANADGVIRHFSREAIPEFWRTL